MGRLDRRNTALTEHRREVSSVLAIGFRTVSESSGGPLPPISPSINLSPSVHNDREPRSLRPHTACTSKGQTTHPETSSNVAPAGYRSQRVHKANNYRGFNRPGEAKTKYPISSRPHFLRVHDRVMRVASRLALQCAMSSI
ncbi:hypothetical protein EVAR_24072_1 [Eumeta japonica]|uniref:Uncharacterized protein n=1 Tax=Eumeta variegata TaxID=151549 RepID=A0A4C2A7L1_EUMVA|nr:hypothetical protein EVAR_24072_1 [Eumeta japonica]